MARVALIFAALIAVAYGHGRFMKPVSRSSVWRVPEFASQNPPQNYDDNQLYCGAAHQADDPGSNCGVCGDPQSQSAPRDNEFNGKYYAGIITGKYTQGQTIDIEINLTAAHEGAMEWRLCLNPQQETQECFNQHVLQLADGSGTKYPVQFNPGMHYTKVKLPAGVTCSHCVIQWNYRAGNTWGNCGNGTTAPGCGPQETFRGCSDITIS